MDPEERARLQAIAFGGASDPAEIEAARRALAPVPAPPIAAAAEPVVAPEPPPAAPAAPAVLEPPARTRRLPLAALLIGTAVVAAALGAAGSMLAARIGPTTVADGPHGGTGVRIAATLAAARTGEDRLPTTMTADVDRSSTHVIYETYPGQPPIRWRVWVATAQSGSQICFVVSSDGYASDVTCAARQSALQGVVRFITRDGGEGLSLLDDHGTVGISLVGVD
jgi:hypothetical protein